MSEPVSGRVTRVSFLPGRPDLVEVEIEFERGRPKYQRLDMSAHKVTVGRGEEVVDGGGLTNWILEQKTDVYIRAHPLINNYGVAEEASFTA